MKIKLMIAISISLLMSYQVHAEDTPKSLSRESSQESVEDRDNLEKALGEGKVQTFFRKRKIEENKKKEKMKYENFMKDRENFDAELKLKLENLEELKNLKENQENQKIQKTIQEVIKITKEEIKRIKEEKQEIRQERKNNF